ncbi:TonB-dependent receptor [Rhizorhabdus argentea]|uniref:TonB-dependent receptor n=1 Tax=Rhizorhabdus argentea TaxID=1387174 RepID=UPI0030EF635B
MPDRLMVRVAGQWRKRDGFTTGIPSYTPEHTKLDNIDKAQWRVSVIWRPTDTIENYTVYAGSHTRSNGNGAALVYSDPRFQNPFARDFAPATFPSTAAAFEFLAGYAPPAGKTYAQFATDALARQTLAGPRKTFYNYNLRGHSSFTGFVNQTRWEITPNVTLKNIFGVFWSKSTSPGADIDGVDVPLLDTRGFFAAGTTSSTSGRHNTRGGFPSRQWRNEIQLQGKAFDNRLDWQTGFYYRQNAIRDWNPNQGFLVAYGGVIGDPINGPINPADGTCAAAPDGICRTTLARSSATSYAAYGQGTFAITPEVHVTGGFRHTWDRSRSDITLTQSYLVNFKGNYFSLPVMGRDSLPGAPITTTRAPTATANTYTIGADWQVSRGLFLYATHRTGYKGGGINGNAPLNNPLRIFGPEKIKDVEIGAKADWELGGMRGRTNIAIYKDWYSSIQRNVILPNGGGQTVTSNVADATIQGIEFETSVNPTPWFQLSGSFVLTDAKYSKWIDNTTCAANYWYEHCAGLPGTTPVVIDHARGNLTIGSFSKKFKPDVYGDTSKYMWNIQPSLLLKPWIDEDITLTANIYHKSSFIGGDNPTNTSVLADTSPLTVQSALGPNSDPYLRKGYTIMDLRFDWRNIRGSRFSAAGSMTNVTNKTYIVSGISSFTLTGTQYAQLSEPRSWYLQLRYDF